LLNAVALLGETNAALFDLGVFLILLAQLSSFVMNMNRELAVHDWSKK
jgi:hypothetical protein